MTTGTIKSAKVGFSELNSSFPTPGHAMCVCIAYSFFLSWFSRTQPNHWTKQMTSTGLAT